MNKNYFYLAGSMALVGSNVTLGKIILQEIPIFTFSFLRFLLVAILFSWDAHSHFKEFLNLKVSDRWKLLGMAGIGFFGFTLFMLMGLKSTSALEAGLLTSLIPLAGVLFSVLFLKEKLSSKIYFSLILAIAGVSYLNIDTTSGFLWSAQGNSVVGQGFVLLGVACEGAYVVFARNLSQKVSAKAMTFLMSFFSAVYFLPLFIYEVHSSLIVIPSLDISLKILIYVCFGSILAVQLWIAGAKHIEAHRASLMTSMVPVFAALTAVVLLKESFTLKFFISALLIFISLTLVMYEKKQSLK